VDCLVDLPVGNDAKMTDIWRRLTGRGVYPHQFAFLLLLPFRRMQLSPVRLLRHLQLSPSERVLELGPGPGFFSIDVARAIPDGRLTLVDIQQEMLQKARRRLQRKHVHNVGYVQADGTALPFRSGRFDVVFLVAALGEVSDPKSCLLSISRVLRPGGRLSITEVAGDPDSLREEDLKQLVQGTHLEFVRSAYLRGGFIAAFRRRS
jgi:ubiquinone/menaquinone biosynthesis C-methylase UbiE